MDASVVQTIVGDVDSAIAAITTLKNEMTTTRTLTVSSHNGLANRLMVLLSGLAIAEASQRYFRMYWVRTAHCGADFAQLFRNPWNVVPIDEADFYARMQAPWFAEENLLVDTRTNISVHHCGYLTRPGRYPTHKALQLRISELLTELAPLVELEARIEAFRERRFRESMIGVHMRLGDLYGQNSHFPATIDDFFAAVDAQIDATPHAGILLCTDDGAPKPNGEATRSLGIAALFEQRYGARVVRPVARSLHRWEPEAIQDAVVELFLLRATRRIVGTKGSTFSALAARGMQGPHAFINVPKEERTPDKQRSERHTIAMLVKRARDRARATLRKFSPGR